MPPECTSVVVLPTDFGDADMATPLTWHRPRMEAQSPVTPGRLRYTQSAGCFAQPGGRNLVERVRLPPALYKFEALPQKRVHGVKNFSVRRSGVRLVRWRAVITWRRQRLVPAEMVPTLSALGCLALLSRGSNLKHLAVLPVRFAVACGDRAEQTGQFSPLWTALKGRKVHVKA